MLSATRNPAKGASKAVTDPHIRLAVGIVARAAQEAVYDKSIEAVAWLQSDDCLNVYCFVAGLDSEAIKRFARKIDLAQGVEN